ncbi:hypothetical protein [Streptomyces cinnamoneus]|uniref:Uncharacterized protein n=1 Tax=Streptomyces cinnamoneus TaxID=53446 RepID=A0A918TSX8_STRCJ|nr:hypothetical protein [Streptomyces cinnamoneus]GHC61986.1 hypothetical protein GCM10010507_43900 [Streptomyces cinnamoneus]
MFVFFLVLRLARRRVRRLVHRRCPVPAVPAARVARPDFAGQVCGDLAAELPEEDLGQDLDDCLDRYVLGSKPRCEEVEYLELVQEAIDRIERGR